MATEKINKLILLVLSGEANPEEKKALKDWINQSPEHAAEFKRSFKLFVQPTPIGKVNVDNAWIKVKQATFDKQPMLSKKKKYISPIHWAACAAVLFFVASASFYFIKKVENTPQILVAARAPILILDTGEKITLSDQSFSIQKNGVNINHKDKILSYQNEDAESEVGERRINHLCIPIGETYKIELSDGTRITLNALSELIYPIKFGKGNREVTLKGEAFFEVAKDESRPFIVNTDPMAIQVLGTAFNVSCYATETVVNTTLLEGSVKVNQGDDSCIIMPSQQYTYNKNTGKHNVATVNVSEATAWLQNEYVFKNTTLEEILMRLQLWHPYTVKYKNEQVKKLRFSFTINKETEIDKIIELLNYTNEVRIEKDNHIIHVHLN